jgi:hypothetical protein
MSVGGARTDQVEPPTWEDFEETSVPEFRPRSPHAELADVLRRYRADLDAAARSAAYGRAQSLRALAEQAVLAVELERLLDRQAAEMGDRFQALRRLKDRMLERVEEAGLEVVHLDGASAEEVAGLAEIEHWLFADSYLSPVVVEELEAAVRVDGAPLRMGRVVMGAPRGQAVAQPIDSVRGPEPPAAAVRPPDVSAAPSADRTRIVCPIEDCGAQNEPDAEVCVACLTLLVGYRRLSLYPEVLFNRGLRTARAGDSRTARECFAAVALWLPEDARARNAYALACLDAADGAAAARAWSEVLALAPDDPLAVRGLKAMAAVQR